MIEKRNVGGFSKVSNTSWICQLSGFLDLHSQVGIQDHENGVQSISQIRGMAKYIVSAAPTSAIIRGSNELERVRVQGQTNADGAPLETF